jgi:thiol-disulfide isomerase/thioredoxin
VAVIDLWATWCTACEQERPKLERLHAAYGSQGLRVVGLNVGESTTVVSAYLAENRVSYPIYLDSDFRLADALGEKRLPMILVVDRSGRIVQRSTRLDAETLAVVKAQLVSRP